MAYTGRVGSYLREIVAISYIGLTKNTKLDIIFG